MIGDTDFLGWQCVGGLSFPDNFIARDSQEAESNSTSISNIL